MPRKTQFRLLVALTIVWLAWAAWSMLGRSTTYELRVLDDQGAPVQGAVVDVNGQQVGTTASDGLLEVRWTSSRTKVDISAPGHVPQSRSLTEPPQPVIDVVLNARVLRGSVVNSSGDPVDGAVIITDSATGVSDGEGRFVIRGAEQGEVRVERPAWMPATVSWDGSPGDVTVAIEPFAARAVHISGEAVADRFDEFIDMAVTTELNALMIDLKDETGMVWFNTSNATAREIGAARGVYDLQRVITEAHGHGLYVIGRVVAFTDPVAARGKPEIAVWDTDINGPYSHNGQYFLDPTDPEARAYAMELAVEACASGLDELQFDYVRFPDSRRDSARFDGGADAEVRIVTISSFLAEAKAELNPLGCAVAADIFGFITRAQDDGGIGQEWVELTSVLDVASPMVYPSHYGPGWYGFDNPNEHPAEMVSSALDDAISRASGNVIIRPWLQAFRYTSSQIRAQIDSAEARGMGWMLWNSESNFNIEALEPKP